MVEPGVTSHECGDMNQAGLQDFDSTQDTVIIDTKEVSQNVTSISRNDLLTF